MTDYKSFFDDNKNKQILVLNLINEKFNDLFIESYNSYINTNDRKYLNSIIELVQSWLNENNFYSYDVNKIIKNFDALLYNKKISNQILSDVLKECYSMHAIELQMDFIETQVIKEVANSSIWFILAEKKIRLYTSNVDTINHMLENISKKMHDDMYKYKEFCLLQENEPPKTDKSSIPLNKQIQAVAKELYQTYIDAGQFKYKMQDKIKKMRDAGMSDEDIEDATAMGDDQLAKLEAAVGEIEARMIAMAGDNAKLAQSAEVWAGEAKSMAAKKNQEFMEKRAKKLEDEAEKIKDDKKEKEKVSGDK